MPYIGQSPSTGQFIELDALTASATDTYTLQLNSANFAPESVNNLIVSINGVVQKPSSMSLNGSSLTVGATLSSSDTIDYVRVLGHVGSVVTPTDGSVTSAKLDTNIAISGNLDVGTIRATNGTSAMSIDSSGRILTPARPAFRARIAGSSSATGTQGVLVFETEDFDIGGNYDTSNGRFTAPIAGIYWFAFNIITATSSSGGTPTSGDSVAVRFIKNGSDIEGTLGYSMVNANYQIVLNSVHILQLSASDYVQVNVSSEFAYSDATAVNDPVFQGYLIG